MFLETGVERRRVLHFHDRVVAQLAVSMKAGRQFACRLPTNGAGGLVLALTPFLRTTNMQVSDRDLLQTWRPGMVFKKTCISQSEVEYVILAAAAALPAVVL